MRSFTEFRVRRDLQEQGSAPPGQGVGPGLVNLDGQSPADQSGGESRQAFRDLEPVLTRALAGPSGRGMLNDIVNAIMNDDQIPDALKQELKAKIGSRWSHLIDLNQAESPGRGHGLANANPASAGGGFGMDGMNQGSVMPADGRGSQRPQ